MRLYVLPGLINSKCQCTCQTISQKDDVSNQGGYSWKKVRACLEVGGGQAFQATATAVSSTRIHYWKWDAHTCLGESQTRWYVHPATLSSAMIWRRKEPPWAGSRIQWLNPVTNRPQGLSGTSLPPIYIMRRYRKRLFADEEDMRVGATFHCLNFCTR